MGTVDHPWQKGKKGTQFSMPSLKGANGPAVMSWCQSRAWKCSFSYTSHSSGHQRDLGYMVQEKKANIGLVLVIPVFLYLGILIVFICPSPWLQNESLSSRYCSHPAVVCAPFSCNAESFASV